MNDIIPTTAQAEEIFPAYRVEDTIKAEPAPKALHKDAQAELDKIPAQIEAIKASSKFLYVAEDLERRYPEWYSWKALTSGEWKVMVSFQFKAVAEAAEVLKYLAQVHGVHITQKMWIYEQDKSLNWTCGPMRISGHFRAAEAKCKFVKTGTKVVDVFEMQCESAGAPIGQAELQAIEGPAAEIAEGLPF